MTANRYEILDLLRGIAAFAVLLYHSVNFVGAQYLPNAYLAVDLFFMLSGFVIAHSYDGKLAAGMKGSEFLLNRWIRLYPCYLLAFAIGFVLGSARFIQHAGYVDSSGLLLNGLSNLLMLPAVVPLYDEGAMYPFNGASWSLFYELVANAMFLLLFPWLNRRNLALLVGVSGVLLVAVVLRYETIDVGMRQGEYLVAMPRVCFSFFVGVLIRRHLHELLRVRMGGAGIAASVMVLVATFSIDDLGGAAWRGAFELLAVGLVFPLMILLTAHASIGPRLGALCEAAGNTSYPVYILQTPLMLFTAAIPQLLFSTHAAAWVPWIGVVEVAVIVVLSWFVDRYYELPLRRWLKQRLGLDRRRQAKPAVSV